MLASFLRLLRGQPADRVVWTADLAYWMAGQQQAGTADPRWDTEEGFLRFHLDLGIMPYYYYDRFWAAEARYAAGVEWSSERQGDQTTHRLRTPVGGLTEVSRYLPASCTTACVKHFVEDEADLRVLLWTLERRRLEPANLDDYPQRMAWWSERGGLPCLALPRSPLPAFVYQWAGIERTAYLVQDCPDLVRTVLDLMEAQEEPVLDAVCRLAPPLVHFPDNLASDNLTGYYDRFLAGTHARRLDRLHRAGCKAAVHLDGRVQGLLPKLVAVGFDAVEALTPRPAGDLELEEIRPVAGSDAVILWGGVPGVLFAPPYTWRDMETHVRRLLRAWAGLPFVVGVADQVPPDGDIGYCLRIAELLDGGGAGP